MDSDDDWKKPRYKNWVRGAKGLEYLQKGLQNDVAELVLRHRDQLVQSIASSVHGPPSQCNLCSDNNLLPEHAVRSNCRHNCIQRKSANCFGSKTKHQRRVCPNGFCSKLYDKIVNSHRHKDPLWTNTDPSTWCSDPAGWSFAKCFQSTPCPGTSSSETDAAGLLSIILNDTFFQTKVACNLAAPNNYFSVARQIRNDLLHCPTMELDDTKLQDYINTFIAVLQDRMFTDDMSREAVQSLVQLKNNEITISLSEEVKLVQVRMEALRALEQLQKKEQEVVTKLETQSQEALTKIKEAELSALDEIGKHEIQQRLRQTEETIQHLTNTIQQMKKENASGRQTQSPDMSVFSDLQKDLILYYKDYHKNIPLSPLLEEDQPLLKFYEMPDILTVKVTRSRDGDRLEKKRVQALRDVFYKENKLFSNIYLTADAGYGKTAFSKKLALAWCHAKQPDKREKKHFSKDEVSAMDGFSFVFVVLLRDSSSECDIDELIFYHILSQLPHNYSLENLRKILCEETCLVILDGLDEWTHPLNTCRRGESNIPHKTVRENVAVLTTTRPWKLSVIGLHSSQIDQKLELEGLSNVSAKKLKRSVISHLHGEQEKNKIDEYEKEFNMTVQDSHKSDLTVIPLFLMYLLFLWFYKFKIGKSLADLYGSFIELLLSRTVNKDRIQIPKTETVQGNIVPCIDKNKLCKQFYTLLTTLGKLAYKTLYSKIKENTLVFDGCVAEKYLRKDFSFCLKTGIITQSKVQGDLSLQQTTKVSFAHKTMQEFLAALYINSGPDQKSVQEIVLSKCKCVKDILDMSKIFMFIVSISGKFSFSREMMKIINEDEITQEYRNSLQGGSSHPLKDLQDMHILCCKEIPRENEANICLQDVIIDNSCKQAEYRENLKQLTTRNKQNIRSVYIIMSYMEYTLYDTERKVIDYFSLSDPENIEKIHYTHDVYSDDILHLLNSSVKSLSLSRYTQQGSWSRSLSDKVRSLQKLEAIEISGFNMSHSELSLLLDFISQRDCLREIELKALFCTVHEYSCTGLSIDLTRNSSLRKLRLNGLKLSQVIINMASLENCGLVYLSNQDIVLKFLNCADNKLNTFDCWSLDSSAAIDEIVRMLRESRHVRKVNLSFINLGRRSLPLSPDCVNIEDLMLENVSMKAAELKKLVDFVFKLKQTVTVVIWRCTISRRKKFETLKRKIKTSQRVTIVEDWGEYGFKFVTIKDGD